MPHTSIYFPKKWSAEEMIAFMNELARVAARHGYTNERGPASGAGNIRELMQAVVEGQIALVPLDDELGDEALAYLQDLLAQPSTEGKKEIISALVEALEEAQQRQQHAAKTTWPGAGHN